MSADDHAEAIVRLKELLTAQIVGRPGRLALLDWLRERLNEAEAHLKPPDRAVLLKAGISPESVDRAVAALDGAKPIFERDVFMLRGVLALVAENEELRTENNRLRVEAGRAGEREAVIDSEISEAVTKAVAEVEAERDRLHALINTPEILDFLKAIQLEAAHQRERWGTSHDGGKTDADWFWLLGYLGGKALHNPMPDGSSEQETIEKKLHRIITVGAAACNWHAAVLGKTDMRPGTESDGG